MTRWLLKIIGLLGAALLYVAGQRNRAREAAARAKAESEGRAAVQDAERAIDRARQHAREASRQTRVEREKRDSDTRPSGDFRR